MKGLKQSDQYINEFIQTCLTQWPTHMLMATALKYGSKDHHNRVADAHRRADHQTLGAIMSECAHDYLYELGEKVLNADENRTPLKISGEVPLTVLGIIIAKVNATMDFDASKTVYVMYPISDKQETSDSVVKVDFAARRMGAVPGPHNDGPEAA